MVELSTLRQTQRNNTAPLHLICMHTKPSQPPWRVKGSLGRKWGDVGRLREKAPSGPMQSQKGSSEEQTACAPPQCAKLSFLRWGTSPVLTSKTTEGRLSWAPQASTNVRSSPAPALYYINHLCKARCSPERSHIIANCFINKISWEIRTAARYSTKIDLQSGKIKPLGTACTWGEKKRKPHPEKPKFWH